MTQRHSKFAIQTKAKKDEQIERDHLTVKMGSVFGHYYLQALLLLLNFKRKLLQLESFYVKSSSIENLKR